MFIGPSYGLTRKQFLLCAFGGFVEAARGQPNSSLALELQRRSASEGLALLRIRNNWIDCPMGGGTTATRNPKGNSLAWFSANGDFVAWWILNSAVITHACPASIAITKRSGELLWRLPGRFRGETLIQTLGLSQDGRRVALCAANVSDEEASQSTPPTSLSLQWMDIADMKVVHIGDPVTDRDTGSISWAPNGNSFVFDRAGKVLVYDLALRQTSVIADGKDPTWSPNGNLIAFRTNDGSAVAINPTTREIRSLLGNRKILSPVQWSPDSQYIVVTEPVSALEKLSNFDFTITALTRIYRLGDMSSVIVERINIDSLDDRGRWWSWILDYSGFLKGAQTTLPLHCKN